MIKIICVIFLIIINSILTVGFVSQVSIGTRLKGDEHLIGDVLHSNTKSNYPTNLTIDFEYEIDNLITYIWLGSKNNVEFTFDLKYEGILIGKAVAINAYNFELAISIYGFKSRKNISEDFKSIFDGGVTYTGILDDVDDYEDYVYKDVDDPRDTVMELGKRQANDILLYDKWDHSDQTVEPEDHSITFYFIDNVHLTYTKFIAIQTATATVTYVHLTNRSMKAIIEDKNVTSLSVKFLLYGYKGNEKPQNYKSLIAKVLDKYNDNNNYYINENNDELCSFSPLKKTEENSSKNIHYNINFILLLIGINFVIN